MNPRPHKAATATLMLLLCAGLAAAQRPLGSLHALCVERCNDTSLSGSEFPFDNNDSGLFPSSRNQYLFPAGSLVKLGPNAPFIESIQARAVAWAAPSVNVYTAASSIAISMTSVGQLSSSFIANATGGTRFLDFRGPSTFSTFANGPVLISDFVSRGASPATRNDLESIIDFRVLNPLTTNLLVDMQLYPAVSGSSGDTAWDVTDGPLWNPDACPWVPGVPPYDGNPHRLFASPASSPTGTVDSLAFVWYFHSVALVPPTCLATHVQQFANLLLTPEGIRALGLDPESPADTAPSPLIADLSRPADPAPLTIARAVR